MGWGFGGPKTLLQNVLAYEARSGAEFMVDFSWPAFSVLNLFPYTPLRQSFLNVHLQCAQQFDGAFRVVGSLSVQLNSPLVGSRAGPGVQHATPCRAAPSSNAATLRSRCLQVMTEHAACSMQHARSARSQCRAQHLSGALRCAAPCATAAAALLRNAAWEHK